MGSGERGLHHGHGLEHGREPPGRLSLRDGGAAARRDSHPCRPAFHPHFGNGQYSRGRCPGTDIAFLGGVIRYILFEDKWFKEFALAYTNIATIIEDGFVDAEDGDGIFSGFQPASASYVQDDLAV